MNSICRADCETCRFKETCNGCAKTCGSPFGGKCVAAEYIRVGGLEAYRKFKDQLKAEINSALRALDIPETDALYELPGEYVNLPYPLSNGQTAKFLNDKNIYLGAQIEIPDCETCCGVVADMDFILICRYETNGTNPELIYYRKR